MRLGLTAMLATVALAGCGQSAEAPAPDSSPAAAVAMPTATAIASEPASAAPAAGTSVKDDNADYEFSFSYPAQAAAIPALKAALDGEMARAKSDLVAESRSDRASAAKDGYPFHAHSGTTDWKIVTDLPNWLSLSAELYGFSGGAHGMSNFDALLWDKQAGLRRAAIDLFTSAPAFRAAVTQRFCRALDRERAKRRGADYPKDDTMFSGCIDPVKEATLILGSNNGATFDRVGFLIAPYSAGPYAEGSYEVTLPVDAALLATVKPQYRAAFSAS